MVRALLALLALIRSAPLLEVVGAGLIVWGVYLAWGLAAALIAGGSALVLKAFELDTRAESS